jgi:hypothetical protein
MDKANTECHKTVLIISYAFPPLNSIAAQRFGFMVEYFAELGWKVFVLTNHSSGSLPIKLSEEQIIRIGTNIQAGQNVSYIKNEIPLFYRWVRNLLHKFNTNFRALDRSLFTWYRQVKRSKSIIYDKLRDTQPDIIIASYGPAAALWLGRYLSKHYKTKWVADFRDLGALNSRKSSVTKFIDKTIEKFILKSACATTSMSKTSVKLLVDAYQKPAHILYNGWHEAITANINDVPSPTMAPYLYYAGRFYLHQLPSVELLFKTLILFPQIRCIIRSLGPANINEQIINLAKSNKVLHQLDLLPDGSLQQVMQEASKSLLNIVFEDLSKDELPSKGTLTGKFLQLLPLSPLVLVIARDDNDMQDILLDTKKGKVCSTIEDIQSFIQSQLTVVNTTTPNLIAINKYSKKEQTRHLLDFLQTIL